MGTYVSILLLNSWRLSTYTVVLYRHVPCLELYAYLVPVSTFLHLCIRSIGIRTTGDR
jgi:hypothetical protein